MQIIGLDISKASVSCCLITEKVSDARQFYYNYNFQKFAATVTGISELLTLIGNAANTIAIMEPGLTIRFCGELSSPGLE